MINTREIATEYRLSHWAQIIRERQESGLSIRAYCKQAGFHENRFFYWQRRVRRAACEQLTENNHETASTIQAINNFTEVKLLPTPERFPLSHASKPGFTRTVFSTGNAGYVEQPVNNLLKTAMKRRQQFRLLIILQK